MNLATALIKRVLELDDFDTWSSVRKHYLPSEYHKIFEIVSNHTENYYKLPTFEELKLGVIDAGTLDKVYAIESVEVDAEPFLLLDYLKNEFAQKDTLFQLEKWIDSSIAFESAEDVVNSLQQIIVNLEDKVDFTDPGENMQTINLFDSDEELAARFRLGLNAEFDAKFDFRVSDYIMVGGRRGSGKSLLCSNVANHIIEDTGKIALYFSIEMEPRELLQRACAISTKIPFIKIRNSELSVTEWEKVVRWWATRHQDSASDVEDYLQHRSFKQFHFNVTKKPLSDAYLDIVYDPSLTLSKIIAEVARRKRSGKNIGIIIIDYINKVKRQINNSNTDHLDWKEQLAMSHSFKVLAQEGVPVLSPYQTDATGEARMAKGILDSCDAAFTMDAHTKKDSVVTLNCTKMRNANDEENFTSVVDWLCLAIGPETGVNPKDKVEVAEESSGGESHDDVPF